METDAVPAAPAVSAGVLRDAMVDKLLRWGGVRTAPVERALRVVPRHVFVPDVSLEQAYGSGSVVTHRDTDGTAISSASGPGVVAAMLEQLEVRPGHRVLEIGAGTGYNAACLAELAGPGGEVTAVDIGADIAAGARRGLDLAGYGSVRVFVGDGEYGYAARAPYNRVIVTAGAWDVPAAWKEQLAPGGRLVVPLRIRGVTRSVGLELHAGVWRSVSVEECGFMPVRGAGAVAERNVELLGDSGVRLRVDDGQPIDVNALGAALAVPAVLAWSGVVVPEKPFDHLDFWLAGTAAAAVCRVFVFDRALERGLARPIYPWGSMGLYTADSFAYLIRRPAGGAGEPMCEIGVCAYGPDADQLGGRAAAQVRAWGQARETLAGLRVEVHPAGSADVPGAMMTVDKTSSRVFVSAIPA